MVHLKWIVDATFEVVKNNKILKMFSAATVPLYSQKSSVDEVL